MQFLIPIPLPCSPLPSGAAPPPPALGTFLAASGEGPSAATLHKVLANVLAHPSEAKYRRLRLANPKVQAQVVDVDGGVETLVTEAGFDVVFEPCADVEEGEEGVAVLPEGADLQVCSRHQCHIADLPLALSSTCRSY